MSGDSLAAPDTKVTDPNALPEAHDSVLIPPNFDPTVALAGPVERLPEYR